jgi:hypothetical protein
MNRKKKTFGAACAPRRNNVEHLTSNFPNQLILHSEECTSAHRNAKELHPPPKKKKEKKRDESLFNGLY